MKLLEKFNIVPNNEDLYVIAFTHSSYSAKHDLDYDYERLEFLGDSVLNMLTFQNSSRICILVLVKGN